MTGKNKIFHAAVFAAVICFLAAACDDIKTEPESQFVPKPPDTATRISGDDGPGEYTWQEAAALYSYIVTTREEVREYGEKGVKIKAETEGDTPELVGIKAHFIDQDLVRKRMIKGRMLKLKKANLPEDHPAKPLEKALYLLKKEVENYMGYLHDRRELDPTIDEELVIYLDQAEKSLEKYQDAPESWPKIKVE